jgi:hypothetical protein
MPLTTEQALRRLKVLGLTIDDPPIRKAVDYMTACLRGERKIDDSWEKTHNWSLFTQLMLSAWLKQFEPENELAQAFANRWARVIEEAFQSGPYDHETYTRAYITEFNSQPRGPREKDFVSFYPVALLPKALTEETEKRFLDYIIRKPDGIYYVYRKSIDRLPEVFASQETSNYLAALELLSEYGSAKEKLGFAVDWLKSNSDSDNHWDLGIKANDGIYFPLSDSWRKPTNRKIDCTERVSVLIKKLDS